MNMSWIPGFILVRIVGIYKNILRKHSYFLKIKRYWSDGSLGFCESDALIMLLLKRKTEFLHFMHTSIPCTCRGRLTACWLGAVWVVTSTYGSVRRVVRKKVPEASWRGDGQEHQPQWWSWRQQQHIVAKKMQIIAIRKISVYSATWFITRLFLLPGDTPFFSFYLTCAKQAYEYKERTSLPYYYYQGKCFFSKLMCHHEKSIMIFRMPQQDLNLYPLPQKRTQCPYSL